MDRRGNRNETLVRRKDGRWAAVLSLDKGKRQNFYRATRREAERALEEVRGEWHDEARQR